MHHYRKNHHSYTKLNRKDKNDTVHECPFPSCNPVNASSQVPIDENTSMYIIKNRVSYDLFEGRRVLDHLMVVPKRHVTTIAEFTDNEKIDQMTIIGNYEKNGYNIYARAKGSSSRSVLHQHTHLIKMRDKPAKLIIFSATPRVLIDL